MTFFSVICDEIRRVVGDGAAYVTIDIDGLDPKEASGTGVPEPGGISMRDLQMVLRAISGLNIIGGDICEVVPSLDPTGITCINAANDAGSNEESTRETLPRREGSTA